MSALQAELDQIDECLDPPDNTIINPDWTAKKAELDAAQAALAAIQAELDKYNSDNYPAVETARGNKDEYETQYYKLVGVYDELLASAKSDEEVARNDLSFAQQSLAYSRESNNQTLALASIELQDIAQQITLAQEKVKKLSGEDGEQISAKVGGVIASLGCTAGETVTADTVLCTIEVPDMGHTLSFSVTKDQAQRLRVGDTATVSNFYWGQEIVATLTSIRNDPKNLQTNKLLTFDLVGDVTTGAELTISVGQKSANYDLIIPNSSIRSDTNGSFVLAVDAKSSPLGNRYVAKRVSVEVLASDDVNSAVTGGLENGQYVITTSSAPVASGDQVRMADSDS